MAIFQVQEIDIEALVSVPETAMGYQLVTGRLKTNRSKSKYFLVLESRFIIPAGNVGQLFASLRELAANIGKDNWVESLAEPVAFEDMPRLVVEAFQDEESERRFDEDQGQASRAFRWYKRQRAVGCTSVSTPEVFFRFNAFANDPRVDSDGNFAPGTYATTYSDTWLVPSGLAAVGRYALPNPMPANYVFPIVTDSIPKIIGTVHPNFRQAGGGVEVLFPRGATSRRGEPFKVSSY